MRIRTEHRATDRVATMVATAAAAVVLVVGVADTARAQAVWPSFRGPGAGAVADDPRLPESWSQTENVVWKADVPGRGWSSPVVAGGLVFLTTVVKVGEPEPTQLGRWRGTDIARTTEAHRWMVYAFDLRTGRLRWEREVHAGVPFDAKHLKNSYASETPVTDGERLYVYSGSAGVLAALDFQGRIVWSVDTGRFEVRNGWGGAASPVLHRGRLFIVNDNEKASFAAAFDARTGQQLWRVARDEGSNWVTPYVWEHPQRTELITVGTKRVRSYDLDGRLLWELAGVSTIAIPTPFAKDGLLYVSSGYVADDLKPAYAIRPGASGDITLGAEQTSSQFVAWSSPRLGSYNPSALVYRDLYYTLHDRGFFTANDAKTGREVYGRQRISEQASGFTASPWAYNGKIFAMSEDGDTFVLQAGEPFKVLSTNSLGETTLATPAVVDGDLVIRTATKLYRVGTPRAR